MRLAERRETPARPPTPPRNATAPFGIALPVGISLLLETGKADDNMAEEDCAATVTVTRGRVTVTVAAGDDGRKLVAELRLSSCGIRHLSL